jgi:hypothetical protein
MKSLERIDEFKRLWTALIPTLACPSDAQILRWASRFSDFALEYAVNRLAAKVRRNQIVAEDEAGRYVTGVLLNEERRLAGSGAQAHV